MTELIKQYYHIMNLYKNGEFGDKHITMNEILTKAGQPDLLDRMNLDELQYLRDNSEGITKLLFSELISKKYGVCDDLSERRFKIYAVPYRKSFVVDKAKNEEFKNFKPNLELRKRNALFLEKCTNVKLEKSKEKTLVLKKQPLK